MAIRLCRLGLVDYQAVHQLQLRLVAARLAGAEDDVILVTEHPPVFTLGRRGRRDHLLVSESFLAAHGIELIHIERGGDITYHGPGQLVIYPVLDLRRLRRSITEHVGALEELMLRLAADCGVTAVRDGRGRGIWCGGAKLGSVGIAVRHGVACHGLALNVAPDLLPFTWINPCGLSGVRMTSLARESGREVTVHWVTRHLLQILQDLLGRPVAAIDRLELPWPEVA
ncbi:lipoyl(octanoyl) transferase LipB [Desulfoprunum benzoelyticum]|jgi:lipoyl(octanoyl) transferase|uniref:Octanoyltransferase n=1 Tax=Desulfoprunum benzoelyticum TaxID=1506996 RepID=A0A840UVR9_9BACT|nr:lipoyl(octanoyl) transferase LipB [Desulfoprunum benzoelyticum]MBB5346818.1 lipoyl(octanoyl) transferase [Desulfoprunum benzoelyticum]MBM9531151.1 lipoyl(octanoyl) transferase LipB [Desulfoprunum benzoelyticum]